MQFIFSIWQMPFKGLSLLFCLALLLISSMATFAVASPPKQLHLAYLALKHQDGSLFLDLGCSVDNEDGLGEILKDGANIELKVTITVEAQRSYWANKELVEHVFIWHLSHDHLTREFVLQSSLDKTAPARNRNLSRLLQASWYNLRLPIFDAEKMQALDPNKAYIVNVSLEVNYAEMPPWLEKSPVFSVSRVVPKGEYALPLFIQAKPLTKN